MTAVSAVLLTYSAPVSEAMNSMAPSRPVWLWGGEGGWEMRCHSIFIFMFENKHMCIERECVCVNAMTAVVGCCCT